VATASVPDDVLVRVFEVLVVVVDVREELDELDAPLFDGVSSELVATTIPTAPSTNTKTAATMAIGTHGVFLPPGDPPPGGGAFQCCWPGGGGGDPAKPYCGIGA